MMQQDAANLRVLYIGGTGTISASCVRLSVETGMRVSVLNRGRNTSDRPITDAVSAAFRAYIDAGPARWASESHSAIAV